MIVDKGQVVTHNVTSDIVKRVEEVLEGFKSDRVTAFTSRDCLVEKGIGRVIDGADGSVKLSMTLIQDG